VINNAYGLQCTKICHHIKESIRLGRVDFIVQSTDKNFLVPVGGAIVASPNKSLLDKLNTLYPGRASMSNVMDLFITFLAMGTKKMTDLVKTRKALAVEFKEKLSIIAQNFEEKVIDSKENTISFAVTCKREDLGSKLFLRRVSGCRFIGSAEKEVCGVRFGNYGSSFSGYPFKYFTAACALGLSTGEIEVFLERLKGILND
jgi:O-phospho-L-seryl-tRNASec:L-selenocysteinyl-tRNA synthase